MPSWQAGIPDFFTFVVLSSAELLAKYEPDLAAIAATGSKALLLTAAAPPACGGRLRAACLRSQRGNRRGPRHRLGPVLGGAVLGGSAWARHPRRPSALPARCGALRASRRRRGYASPGMRPPCSPVSCAKESGHGGLHGGTAGAGREPPARRPRARPPPASASSSELARLTAPCDEHADPTHVTASGIVVGPARHGPAPPQAARHLDAARRPHRCRRDAAGGGAARGDGGAGSGGRAPRRWSSPHPPRRPRGGPRPRTSRPALPAARRRRRAPPSARREPRGPLVQLGRGPGRWRIPH